MAEDEIGEELATWGKVALIETVGRTSGKTIRSAVGFVEMDDKTLLIAAGSETTDWALNLRRNPRATATIGDDSEAYDAVELTGPERSNAVTQLILKYGTPAERLGRGPAFRLVKAA